MSPPQGDRAVSLSEAKDRIRDDGLDNHLEDENTDVSRILCFLYGRGFMHGDTLAKDEKKLRIEKVKAIIMNRAAKKRLLQVIKFDGDTDLSAKESAKAVYARTVVTLKRYFNHDGTRGFLREMKNAHYYLRMQKSGNCFLQAPCVLMAYLLQRYGLLNGPVDLSKLIRASFSDDDLFKYVAKDGGGNSLAILHSLLEGVDPDPSLNTITESMYGIDYYFERCGPALVSHFSVNANFKQGKGEGRIGFYQFDGDIDAVGKFVDKSSPSEDEDAMRLALEEVGLADNDPPARVLFESPPKRTASEAGLLTTKGANKRHFVKDTLSDGTSTYTSTPNDEEILETAASSLTEDDEVQLGSPAGGELNPLPIEQRHAMVLIGVRKEGSKMWLLMQNWWASMQLVEVSYEYFRASKGKLTFFSASSDQTFNFTRPVSFNSSHIAECNRLDQNESAADLFQDSPERDV
jgi:hypothetical protein